MREGGFGGGSRATTREAKTTREPVERAIVTTPHGTTYILGTEDSSRFVLLFSHRARPGEAVPVNRRVADEARGDACATTWRSVGPKRGCATPHREARARASTMSTKTLGSRAADVAFKTFTGALFATTVVTGGWFAATSFSAASHYDKLEKEHKAREMREAEERAAEEARRAERKGKWRLFG